MDYDKVKLEVTTDSLGRGYSSMSDEAVANDMNTKYRNRDRESMTGRQVTDEIVDSEYDELTDVKKAQVLALVASQDIDPFGFATNVIKDIFGAGSGTVAALATARVETISRAVELDFGYMRAGDIQQARRL